MGFHLAWVSELIPFIILYTPFWSVPALGISLYFSRIYFKKGQKKAAILFLLISIISISSLIFYILFGGPLKAPQRFNQFIEKPF
jgi:hypothetical protein